jgi:CDP-diacylglycerol--glycerol-3-phosphate 3-phosphatidyltransferase
MSLLTPPLVTDPLDPRVAVRPASERLFTAATVITIVRTLASVVLSAVAASQHSRGLLIVGLVVYWVGDSLDGQVARRTGCETRIGALLDIFSDRLCAAAFYVGLAWLEPHLGPAVFVYLLEFMTVDCFLSISFVYWPIRSTNYFYVIDRDLWRWNWSHPGKAANSGLFAILLLVTGWMWLGLVIALALLVMKCVSLARLLRIGLPVPGVATCDHAVAPPTLGGP